MTSAPGNSIGISTSDDFIDLSIPLRFNGLNPNVYGVDPASSIACEVGDFVGDTRRGGSVNFEQHTLIPHCNGTHTECVGHISEERISIRECLQDAFTQALLVSVAAENAIDSGESYSFELESGDQFLTCRALEDALSRPSPRPGVLPLGSVPSSLIIRSLPNDASKRTRKYDKPVPPFLSNEAAEFIVERGFRHLLVDLPSLDRLYDNGALSNHRIFWNVPAGKKSTNKETRMSSTITELIYVPDDTVDGEYILNLQIAPFESDAAPSRPVLLPLTDRYIRECSPG